MHGDLATDFLQQGLIPGPFQSHEHAKTAHAFALGVVQVERNRTFRNAKPSRTTQTHVLANCRDHVRDHVADNLTLGGLGRRDGFNAFNIQGHGRNVACRVLKRVVLGDKVGFSVQLNDHARLTVGAQHASNQAFGCGTVGLVGRLGQALGAQPVLGRFDIAAIFLQGLLAVHHASTSQFAQVFDQRRGDFRHGQLLQF